MKWKDFFRDPLAGDTIKASILRKIPHLKTCPYWDRATFLGRVSHRLQFGNYDGGLVKYDNKVYYVNRSQIEALRPWIRWDMRKKVTVIDD
ncbi:MAG TPA: hypothetical protein VMV03_13850 [Spirochaetia bacterium]|nr:hypothetical protein [Spirochaetia bacterium]